MCTDGLVQLLMMLAKPRTKLIRTNRNAYYMLIMLMLTKVSEPLRSWRATVWHGTEHVSDAYITVSTHLCLHFVLNNHVKSKPDSNIMANL